MQINTLGPAHYPSPLKYHVTDDLRIPEHVVRPVGQACEEGHLFELAGPRAKNYFAPDQVKAGIVTCGGLCPGLNNVIRSIFLELYHAYGVREVFGFRNGYQGLDPEKGKAPLWLTPAFVDDIHRQGGTVLGTSRGPVDVGRAVDNLMRQKVNVLFTLGGDGTQRGANDLYQEAKRRGFPLAVVGIPKTIDNDVAFVSRTFGFQTAIEEASRIIEGAHIEAKSVFNGVSIVKLMGREAGFIAGGATVANQDVNFTLIPEVPLVLDGSHGFLEVLKARVIHREHAVIVIAEGAGQELLEASGGKDASGNLRLADIGPFLRARIAAYFSEAGIPVTLRYFDPSYSIRSRPADAEDAVLCDLFARNAVHAAMAGKTGLVIGYSHDHFMHIPIELLVTQRKRVDPQGGWWRSVLSATGQPATFG